MQKLINSHGPIEDPSLMAYGARSLFTGATDSLLSYKATSGLISSSSCCFSDWDIDSHLLGLLKVYILVTKYILSIMKMFLHCGFSMHRSQNILLFFLLYDLSYVSLSCECGQCMQIHFFSVIQCTEWRDFFWFYVSCYVVS